MHFALQVQITRSKFSYVVFLSVGLFLLVTMNADNLQQNDKLIKCKIHTFGLKFVFETFDFRTAFV